MLAPDSTQNYHDVVTLADKREPSICLHPILFLCFDNFIFCHAKNKFIEQGEDLYVSLSSLIEGLLVGLVSMEYIFILSVQPK